MRLSQPLKTIPRGALKQPRHSFTADTIMDKERKRAYRKAQLQQAMTELQICTEEYHRAREALMASDLWDADGSVNRMVSAGDHLDHAIRAVLQVGGTVEDILTHVPDLPNWLRDELLADVDDYYYLPRQRPPWMPDQ